MLNRAIPPASEDIADIHFPEPEKHLINEKTPLFLIRQGTQPVILLDIVLPGGRWNEPVPGISYYAAKMLTEGTRTKSAGEIAEQLDFYGSHLEITPTLDYVSVRLFALKKFFPALLDLVIDLFVSPTFPEKEFELLRKIRVQQIRQRMARNNALADLKFREELLGPAHPYGMILDEKKALQPTLREVKQYFSDHFLTAPDIYLAGQVDDHDVRLVEDKIGHTAFSASGTSADKKIVTSKGTTITREESVQASIKLGAITIDRTHPDIHDLKIANELLGGFFGSRLMKNIREEKGLTYGIYSHLIHLHHASYWNIGTEVLKEKASLATEEIFNEIRKLQENPPSAGEMITLKNYMKGKLLTSFDSPFNTAEIIKSMTSAGLTGDYWSAYVHRIDTISPEEVSFAAKKYFDPDHCCRVTVS